MTTKGSTGIEVLLSTLEVCRHYSLSDVTATGVLELLTHTAGGALKGTYMCECTTMYYVSIYFPMIIIPKI